jgi:hypothetical protein
MNATPRLSGLRKCCCLPESPRFSGRRASCRLLFVLAKEKCSVSVALAVSPRGRRAAAPSEIGRHATAPVRSCRPQQERPLRRVRLLLAPRLRHSASCSAPSLPLPGDPAASHESCAPRPEHKRSSLATRLVLSQEWSTTPSGPIVCSQPNIACVFAHGWQTARRGRSGRTARSIRTGRSRPNPQCASGPPQSGRAIRPAVRSASNCSTPTAHNSPFRSRVGSRRLSIVRWRALVDVSSCCEELPDAKNRCNPAHRFVITLRDAQKHVRDQIRTNDA